MNFLYAMLLVLAADGAPASSSLWGGEGHRLVCEIAWRHLTGEAKAMATSLRAGEPGTFSESCTWADQVRGERPETYNYHFINIPPGQSGLSWARDCGDAAKRCVTWAIKYYTQILADSAR